MIPGTGPCVVSVGHDTGFRPPCRGAKIITNKPLPSLMRLDVRRGEYFGTAEIWSSVRMPPVTRSGVRRGHSRMPREFWHAFGYHPTGSVNPKKPSPTGEGGPRQRWMRSWSSPSVTRSGVRRGHSRMPREFGHALGYHPTGSVNPKKPSPAGEISASRLDRVSGG